MNPLYVSRSPKTRPVWSPLQQTLDKVSQTDSPDRRRLLMLRKKTLVRVSLVLTGLLGVIYIASAIFLTNSFRLAEEHSAHQTVKGVLSLFNRTYADFAEEFLDQSVSDDTYRFIQDRNSTYIESNLAPEALARRKVDLVLYFDATGKLIYGTGVDTIAQRKVALPPALFDYLKPGSPLLRSPYDPNPVTGLLLLPSGPMLLTSQPILKSRAEGPMRGTVIFGRHLDVGKLQELANYSHLMVHRKDDPRLLPDIARAKAELTQQSILVRPLNANWIAGYTYIPDVLNQPGLLLRIEARREIYQQGQASLRYLLIILVIVGGVFWFIALLLLEKQSTLYQRVQQFNDDLEDQVQERTLQLRQALDFEALLKRITDKVRDTLDEAHILQTVVQELAQGLEIEGCDTALYDPEKQTFTIVSEYVPNLPSARGRAAQLSDLPELFHALRQGQYIHCCVMYPKKLFRPLPPQTAILACPIIDDSGFLGDLWLYSQPQSWFRESEIRLVQQVTNQCAIAIRQARLYQTAQAQVEELERLNRLKDDFLSTVSHELRTPMASIKMAIQMLEIALKNLGSDGLPDSIDRRTIHSSSVLSSTQLAPQPVTENPRVSKYLNILHNECEREIGLINDLLDLSRLEAGGETLVLSTIEPRSWLSHLLDPFFERTQRQQQHLEVHIPEMLPTLITDLSKLERILIELLQNACKYTPAGERIRLSVQVSDSLRKAGFPGQSFLGLGFESTPVPPRLLFTVTNTGVELPPDELSRIFDKFYRIPNNDPWKHGGTGLGLALVKRLVIYLGGSIQVKSIAQEVSFTVDLPIDASDLNHSSSLL